MRLQTTYLLVITVFLLAACGPYDMLLKSRNHQAKYDYALKMYEIGKDQKAITLFNDVTAIFSGTDKIDTIKFFIAKSTYRQKDYYTSASLFDEFRKSFTRSPFAEESEYLYAMSHYRIAPGPELDQTHTKYAIAAFEEYIDRYPDSPKVETCQEYVDELRSRLYQKAYLVGENYYNISYYNSAIFEFKNILKSYPNIPTREKILYLIVKSNYEYAKASVETKQRERFYNTIDAFLSLENEYPDSRYMDEARKMYVNSQKMSEGQDIIENVARDLNMSDGRVKRGAKRYIETFEKVQEGKMTKEEAHAVTDKLIDKNKRKNDRKKIKLAADSAAIAAVQMQDSIDAELIEQGLLKEEKSSSSSSSSMQQRPSGGRGGGMGGGMGGGRR